MFTSVKTKKKKKKKNDHKIVYDAICHLSSTLNHIGRLVWVRIPWLNILFPYFTNSSLYSKLIQSNIWSIWNTYCYKHLSWFIEFFYEILINLSLKNNLVSYLLWPRELEIEGTLSTIFFIKTPHCNCCFVSLT